MYTDEECWSTKYGRTCDKCGLTRVLAGDSDCKCWFITLDLEWIVWIFAGLATDHEDDSRYAVTWDALDQRSTGIR